MRRIFKQLLIITVFLLFLGSLAGLIWWLSQKKPTCFDGLQNGTEEGIDCGLACGNSCGPKTDPISPIALDKIQVIFSGGKCDIATKIINPNSSYGAQHIPYQITWGGFSKKGEFYIFPSEERFLIDANIPCDSTQSPKVEIGSPSEWKYFRGFEKPNLEMSNSSFTYTDGPDFAEAKGIITNKSPFDLKEIEVYAIIKSSKEEIIAINKTTINSLMHGENREFRVFWTRPFPLGGISSFYTTANIFGSDNFLKIYGAESANP